MVSGVDGVDSVLKSGLDPSLRGHFQVRLEAEP